MKFIAISLLLLGLSGKADWEKWAAEQGQYWETGQWEKIDVGATGNWSAWWLTPEEFAKTVRMPGEK